MCEIAELKKAKPGVVDKIDDFDKKAIQRKVHSFWLSREIPTLSKILTAINEDETMPNIKETSLRIVLKSCAPNPTGKGKRLIILHIGSVDGFVRGGLLCFESKKNTSDYHDEMNGQTFKEWFEEILPLLKDNAVVVIDNAPYHSVKSERIPTMSWKKADIVNWIQSKGEEADPSNMIKSDLMDIVRRLKPK